MNGINNISFGRRNNNLNTADKKNNRKRNAKAAVALGITAAAIGGIALYKNRNSKPVLKFRNFIKDGVMSPLKEKNVTLKKKVSNVWNNLKDGVKGLKTKSGNYSDTLEIKNPKVQAESKAGNIEKPAKPEAKEDIAVSLLDKKLDAKAEKTKGAEKPCKPIGKNITQAPAGKASETSKKQQNTGNNTADLIKNTGANVLDAAKNHARDLRVAAGTAAVVTGGVVAGGKIGDAVQENKEKSFSIEYNGKAFKGELKDGCAFDENNNPLNGVLTIKYNSGKKVVIDYKDGKLHRSTLFKSADDVVPETMREYNDGRILNKHDDLFSNPDGDDKSFKSRTVRTFGSDDAMLESEIRYLDETGRDFSKRHFIKNLGKDKKIKGAPINTFSTETRENGDGTVLKKVYIPVNGADKLIRTSSKAQDGSFDITLFGLNGEDIAQLSTDSDKKAIAYWHYTADKDCAVIEIKDGRIAADNYEDAAVNAVLLPDSTENFARYMANDGSIIQIECKDGDISSISSYSNIDDKTPKTKMLFKGGRAFYDIWHDENGEVVFKVKH